VIESKDAANKQFQFIYDRLGRLTARKRLSGGNYVADIDYCYDGNNATCNVSVRRSAWVTPP
jgi:YD repeat-containing protein